MIRKLIMAGVFSLIIAAAGEEKASCQDPYSAALDLVMNGLNKVIQAPQYVMEYQKEITLVQESYDLLNAVLCQKNQFDFYAGLSVNMNSCLLNYNYTMSLVQLNMGYVNIIVAAAAIAQKYTGTGTNPATAVQIQIRDASRSLNQCMEFMQKYGIEVKANLNLGFYQRFGNPYFRSYNYSDITHI